MAKSGGVVVVVEMLTGCGVAATAVVVVVVAGAVTGAAARIQHLTPRLRPRAPSTPFELVMPGLLMNWREIRLSTPYP